MRWNTNGAIRAGVSASLLPPTAEVQLTLTNLDLRPLDPYLEPALNVFIVDSKLGLNGHLRLRTGDGKLPEVTFSGDAWLNDFSTTDGLLGEDLLSWSSVKVLGIEAALHPASVAIREVVVNDAVARVVIETNQTINLLLALGVTNDLPAELLSKTRRSRGDEAQITALGTKSETPHVVAYSFERNPALPKVSIASVVISNAQARFTDRSLTPNVNLSIQQAGGTIAGLSSEMLQPAVVDLRAKVDNVGPAAITGTINPFSATSTNELKIVVSDVDLTPTSPYAGRFAGYRIAKGKLGLTLTYHLEGRHLFVLRCTRLTG